MLNDLVLPVTVNHHSVYSGMDCLAKCLDKNHFKNYPWSITYDYNSRGFRDEDWPTSLAELENAVWCLGDSFTVGLGSPIQHTWPWLLSSQSGLRTINISMDGASNDWISRRARQIYKEIRPHRMVIMWSYWHRRESPDIHKDDHARRLHYDIGHKNTDDFENFRSAVTEIMAVTTPINLLIPNAYVMPTPWTDIRDPSWPLICPKDLSELDTSIQDELKNVFDLWDEVAAQSEIEHFLRHNNIHQVEVSDRARDGHHFDIKTALSVVAQILADWQLCPPTKTSPDHHTAD